jgi:ERCC4-type nuclease
MDYALDVADTVILSAKMKDDSRRKRQVTTISQPQSASSSTSQSQAFSEKGLLSCDPHTFTTFGLRATLIVDEREKNIGSRSRSKTMAEHLTKLNVHYETRVLSVGDFLWLLRLPGGDELVLDYVIERKTWDDLKVRILLEFQYMYNACM